MATPEERAALWESYFYPETITRDPRTGQASGTLRNLLGERDRDVLARKEYGRSADRQRELMGGDADLPRSYDAAHVRSIHRHLFQDVYDWAGEYRTVNIFKGTPRGFADVDGGEIDRYLRDVRGLVDGTAWDRLNLDEFAGRAATVFAYLNQAHPFREGNGRTSKVFMEHVAERSRFTLDYARVTPEQWNEASKYSGPDLFAYEPHPASLVPVFRAIATERPAAAKPELSPELRELRASLDSSYARPAQDAIQKPSTDRPVEGRPRAGYDGRGSTGRSR